MTVDLFVPEAPSKIENKDGHISKSLKTVMLDSLIIEEMQVISPTKIDSKGTLLERLFIE